MTLNSAGLEILEGNILAKSYNKHAIDLEGQMSPRPLWASDALKPQVKKGITVSGRVTDLD